MRSSLLGPLVSTEGSLSDSSRFTVPPRYATLGGGVNPTGTSVSGGRCGHALGDYSAVSGGRNAGANGRYSTNAGFSDFVVNENDESIAGWSKVYYADVGVTVYPDAAVPNGHQTFPGGPPACPAPQ